MSREAAIRKRTLASQSVKEMAVHTPCHDHANLQNMRPTADIAKQLWNNYETSMKQVWDNHESIMTQFMEQFRSIGFCSI